MDQEQEKKLVAQIKKQVKAELKPALKNELSKDLSSDIQKEVEGQIKKAIDGLPKITWKTILSNLSYKEWLSIIGIVITLTLGWNGLTSLFSSAVGKLETIQKTLDSSNTAPKIHTPVTDENANSSKLTLPRRDSSIGPNPTE